MSSQFAGSSWGPAYKIQGPTISTDWNESALESHSIIWPSTRQNANSWSSHFTRKRRLKSSDSNCTSCNPMCLPRAATAAMRACRRLYEKYAKPPATARPINTRNATPTDVSFPCGLERGRGCQRVGNPLDEPDHESQGELGIRRRFSRHR